jgi:hypothetical protein
LSSESKARKASLVVCPRTVYTDLNGLICKMKITVEKLVPFTRVELFERPAKVGQHPQRQQIDAQE